MNPERMIKITNRIAKLDSGPIEKVLDRYWNMIHDFEYELEKAKSDYGWASSYRGKGEKDALYIMDEVDTVLGELSEISTKSLARLSEKERIFIKKWGNPEDYIKNRSSEIFPN